MAKIATAKKRLKQDAKKQIVNKTRKAAVATFEKKFIAALAEKNQESATELLKVCMSKLDKAAKKGVIKKNKADRKKSQLTVNFNKAFA